MRRFISHPSSALIVATVALFVALGGSAGAVVTQQAVPLAKRAFLADNAKRVRGQTPAEIAARGAQTALALSPGGPRPSSTAAGLVTLRRISGTVQAGAPIHTFYVVCGFQEGRVLGGGFSANAPVVLLASYPESEDRWTVVVRNPDPTAAVFVTATATCIR